MTQPTFEPLQPHELLVAVLYADTDLSPRQVGARLGVAERSVTSAASRVYRKLGVGSRAHLRSVMLELELAPVGAP